MHQLFAAFIALVFSFCHHAGSLRSVEASASPLGARPDTALAYPNRPELAAGIPEGGYAESGCLSCETMTVSFVEP